MKLNREVHTYIYIIKIPWGWCECMCIALLLTYLWAPFPPDSKLRTSDICESGIDPDSIFSGPDRHLRQKFSIVKYLLFHCWKIFRGWRFIFHRFPLSTTCPMFLFVIEFSGYYVQNYWIELLSEYLYEVRYVYEVVRAEIGICCRDRVVAK